MIIRFVTEARNEFIDAISGYEEASAGLGARFKDEVDRCILWVSDHPELYRLRPDGSRRINLRAFPYHIPFLVRGETLWILAVAHSARAPLYWISRHDEAI